MDVIDVPAICNVVAFTSPELPYITALLLTIVPADEPSTKFNSDAVEVIVVDPKTMLGVVMVPAKETPVPPVGIAITVVSASFFIVTSFVDPCPVIIIPSDDVNPMAALSPEAVSPEGITVPEVAKSPVAVS